MSQKEESPSFKSMGSKSSFDEEISMSSGIVGEKPAIESVGNNSESEIQHISIRDHAVSYEDIMDMANKILRSPTRKFSIEFCDCDITADHLKSLCEKIKDAHFQITTFTISYMDNVDELLEKTCFIIWKYETTSLSLEYNELSDKSIDLLQRYLEDKHTSTTKLQIESLDISYNNGISAAGFKQLGIIMKKFNIVSLKATDCDITDEKLKKVLDVLLGAKLKELDISCNEKLTKRGFGTLAEFVANKGVDRLELSGCKLSKENIDSFHAILPQTGHEKLLEEFDLSYNSIIEPETSLGAVVVKCGVTKLSLAGCKLRKGHLVCLRKSMKNHKMDLINMRDNASIGQGIEVIAELVNQCQVRELNVCDCVFSAQKLQRFREALGGTQVDILHLGDQRREPDKKYVKELCALLANVKDVLYLRFCKLSDVFRTSLQNSCKHSAKIILTVGGKKEELCSNEKGGVETGGQTVDAEPSTATQIEKTRLEALKKEGSGNDLEDSYEEHSSTLFEIKNGGKQATELTEQISQDFSSDIKSSSTKGLEDDSEDSYEEHSSTLFEIENEEKQVTGSTEQMPQDSSSEIMSYSTRDSDSLEEYSPTLSRTKEFNWLNPDQFMIRSTKKTQSVKSTEKIVQQDSSTSEDMLSSTEDCKDTLEVSPTSLGTKKWKWPNPEEKMMGSTEEMLQEYFPTSFGTEEFERQNLEQPTIGSTIKMVESTAVMMQEDLSTAEYMFSSTEDIEVVFKNEITRIFKKREDFIMFAQSEKGLRLDMSDIHAIIGKDTVNINESQKMAVLKLWRERNESMATPVKMREIVKRYYDIGPEDIVNLRDGRVRMFRNCRLRYDDDDDDKVFLGEVLNITRSHFCAIRRKRRYDPILRAAKQLLDKKHENVVTILNVGTHLVKQSEDCGYIVSELTWTTRLGDISHCRFEIPLHAALNLIKQLFSVFSFLHSNDISCDLSTRSIFVSDDMKKLKLDVSMFEPAVTVMENRAEIFEAGEVLEEIFLIAYPPINNKTEVKESTQQLSNLYPENRPTPIQVLADIAFFQYPFKDAEGHKTASVNIREIVKHYFDIGEEDIEAVFKNEISRIFFEDGDFIMFAQSEKGLHLDMSDIHAIKDTVNINESQKMAVLKLWREKNESLATPVKIREIVKQYHGIRPEDIVNLRDGRVRMFRNCRLRYDDDDDDDKVFLGEISNITRSHFCAIRSKRRYGQLPRAAEQLLDKKHENVVSILDVGTHLDKQSEDCGYIVSELTWTTRLNDISDIRSNIPLHELTALNLIKQLFFALNFLHSNDISCGNLRTRSIFVSDDMKKLKLDSLKFEPDFTLMENTAKDIFEAGEVAKKIFSRTYTPINKKTEVEELTQHMLDPYPENRSPAIHFLADITFFQYPFKDAEDKPAHILVQSRKSTQDKAEIYQWTSDETENFNLIGEFRITEIQKEESVIICDRELTEHDIPITTSDETRKTYSFEFRGCHITKNFLNSFYEKMDSKHWIHSLKVTYMKPGSISGLIEMIYSIVTKYRIDSLSLEHNYMNDDDIDLLQKCFTHENLRLKEIDISYNEDISSDGFRKIGELMRKCHIGSLQAKACDVTDEKLEKFLEGGTDQSIFGSFQIDLLDLSYNPNVTTRGYAELAKFVANRISNALKLSACDLTKEILDEFNHHLPSPDLQMLWVLDLSYNPRITPNAALGSIIEKCRIKTLNLAGCEFTEQHFIHMRNSRPRHAMWNLCLRDNKTISGSLGEIAELVKHWNLADLDLGDCKLTSSDLIAFREKLDGREIQLRTLRLRDNKTISGGLGELAELVKHCDLNELDVGDCMLTASDLRAFREELDGAKIWKLHLGDKTRELDAWYMQEIVKLLSNIRDIRGNLTYKKRSGSLHVECHKLNCDFRQVLMNHGSYFLPVKIKFSDGTTEKWRKYDRYAAWKILKNREALNPNQE